MPARGARIDSVSAAAVEVLVEVLLVVISAVGIWLAPIVAASSEYDTLPAFELESLRLTLEDSRRMIV